MNKNCEIIQDLLPLYVDDVLSEESKKFVDEHLRECEQCQEMLKQMNNELKIPSLQSDKEVIKKLKKKISFKTIFSVFFLVTYVLIWILYFLDMEYTHIYTYSSSISSGAHYEYSLYHDFILFVVVLLPVILYIILFIILFVSIRLKQLRKYSFKMLAIIFMILFNNRVISETNKIAYGDYSGKVNVYSDKIELNEITFEIDEAMKSLINEDTRYKIYYRYNKETLIGKIDSIEKEQNPIKVIKDEKGKELANKYGASYVQVLNLLEGKEFPYVNFDVLNVHETTSDEFKLARSIYSIKKFEGQASNYWTYEIGNKVDLTSNYIAIVVSKDANGFVGTTGIGFIHFPNDN